MAGAAALLSAGAANAFESCGPIRIYDQQVARSGLENSFWFPIGPQTHERTAYALVAPWCPFCRRLEQDILSGKLDFNVRALPTEPNSYLERQKLAAALLQPSDETAASFFERRPSRVSLDLDRDEMTFIVGQQIVLGHNIRRFQEQYGTGLLKGLPTIFGDFTEEVGGFHSVAGYSDEIRDLLNEHLIALPVGNHSAAFTAYEAFRERQPGKVFAATRKDGNYIRVLPLLDAFPVSCVAANTGYTMEGTVMHMGQRYAYRSFGDSKEYLSFAPEQDFEFL